MAMTNRTDRCEPIRKSIEALREEVDGLVELIGPPPEIPPSKVPEFKRILAKDRALLARMHGALVACEAIPTMPPRD
jgi:hypothetical protein